MEIQHKTVLEKIKGLYLIGTENLSQKMETVRRQKEIERAKIKH